MRNPLLLDFLVFRLSLAISRNLIYNTSTFIEPLKELSDKENEVWCKFQPNGYDCKETGRFTQNYYFDTKLEDCTLFSFGTCQAERNKFNSLKDCRENCLDTGLHDILGKVAVKTYCKFQPDFGHCHDYYPKFYFDLTTRTCKGFSYSGCGGNLNRFSTAQLCSTVCGKLADDMSKERT